MKQNIKRYLFSIFHLLVFVFSIFTDWNRFLVFVLIISLVLMMIDKVGKGIVLREAVALHSCFVCLFMPLIGYMVYTRDDSLAALWVRYMPLAEEKYFAYALPAMSIFVFTLCLPMTKQSISDEGKNIQLVVEKAVQTLKISPSGGLGLVIIGLVTYFLASFLPDSVQFAVLLFYFAAFAGILYIYFTPKLLYKKPIFIIFIGFILWNALSSGMFTIIAYMGITIFSFLFLKRKIAFWKKISFFLLSITFVFFLQSIKQSYRKEIWRNNYEGNKATLFFNLLAEKFTSTENFFSSEAFFPMYYRSNQGYNVALVMRRIPAVQPHDNGENIALALASSVVPRVLWPNKPEAGGKFNMKFYAGIDLRGWSTNISPLGEGYGAFGSTGGVIFVGLLGLLIRGAYGLVFAIARKTPLIVFWIPFLFYQITYSFETDTLQITNSLIKSGIFLFVLYKFMPYWFGRKVNLIEAKKQIEWAESMK